MMSSYQAALGSTPNGISGTTSPSISLASGQSNTSSVNNGPANSPILIATTSSPVLARPSQPTQSQPEQIIVPVGNVINTGKASEAAPASTRQSAAALIATQATVASSNNSIQVASGSDSRSVLERSRLRDLVKEVDPMEQMDDDVEDVLLQVADDFIENVVSASCQLAKHRRSNTLEAKDVQLYLERSWNMQIPGFGSEEIHPYKKSATTEAHKQRMALIRKALKKY